MNRFSRYTFVHYSWCAGAMMLLGLWVNSVAQMPVEIGAFILNNSGIEGCSATKVPVSDAPFDSAVELTSPVSLRWGYEVQYSADIFSSLGENDVVVLTFFMRSAEPGHDASVAAVVENVSNYNNSLFFGAKAGNQWRKIVAPFRIRNRGAGFEPGEAGIRFRIGMDIQKVQIGGIRCDNYGPVDIVPFQDSLTYPGMEADAPWRAEAKARIEDHRKGDLHIAVADESGNAVSGATVTVMMKRHAFHFGCLVNTWQANPDAVDEGALQYKAEFIRFFNHAVLQDFKWDFFENRERLPMVMASLKWLHDNNISTRAHVLVYPRFEYNPDFVQEQYQNDPEGLRQVIYQYITEAADSADPWVEEIDVCNELGDDQNGFNAVLGMDETAQWFIKAREHTGARLFMNEYGLLMDGGANPGYQRFVEENLIRCRELGAPIDGIGMQSHLGIDLPGPETLYEIIERFARHGVVVKSTELTVNIASEQLQARYLEDYMTMLFSHPAVNGIVLWGYKDGRIWMGKKGIVASDGRMKPAGEIWLNLSRRTWWTDTVTLTAGGKNPVALRGFKGVYDIVVSDGSRSDTLEVNHFWPQTDVFIKKHNGIFVVDSMYPDARANNRWSGAHTPQPSISASGKKLIIAGCPSGTKITFFTLDGKRAFAIHPRDEENAFTSGISCPHSGTYIAHIELTSGQKVNRKVVTGLPGRRSWK